MFAYQRLAAAGEIGLDGEFPSAESRERSTGYKQVWRELQIEQTGSAGIAGYADG